VNRMKRLMMASLAATVLFTACNMLSPDPWPNGCGDGALAKANLSCPVPQWYPWKQPPPAAYSFTYTRHMFILAEGIGPYFVTVDQGVVVSVARRTYGGDTVPVTHNLQSYSLDTLWSDVSRSLAQPYYSVFVRYDSLWGFPDSVYIDWIEEAVDDEGGFIITDFTPWIQAD
jgi:hypothetical protein